MEQRKLKPASRRRKLSALSSLFDYLCDRNAVIGNPVDGVERPKANGNEGNTPALGDRQARRLLEAPPTDTLKGIRDRAILATLLYHGLRRGELCALMVSSAIALPPSQSGAARPALQSRAGPSGIPFHGGQAG